MIALLLAGAIALATLGCAIYMERRSRSLYALKDGAEDDLLRLYIGQARTAIEKADSLVEIR